MEQCETDLSRLLEDPSLSKRYFAKAWMNQVPVYVTLELSLRCNLRCVHCYNFDRELPYPKEKKGRELTREEIFTLIDDLADSGTLFLSITGGEPMMHPNFFEIVEKARSRKLSVRIKTNAIFLDEQKAQRLKEFNVSDMDISLYGATAETHDTFTKQKGSFEKTWRGIRIAKKYGLNPCLSYVLHRGCVDEFASMIQLADQEAVPFRTALELSARNDGTTGSIDHRLTESDLMKLYTGASTRDYFAPMMIPRPADAGVQCGCARIVCGIGSDGSVYPCIGAPVLSGNLRENRFKEIWANSPQFAKIRGYRTQDFKDCAGCGDRPYCQRSSGVVYSNTGDYTAADEWSCMSAKVARRLSQESTQSSSRDLA